MDELIFTVPGKPQPKQRPRIAKGRAFTPKQTKDYEAKVRGCCLAAIAANEWPLDAKYSLSIQIYFPDRRRRDLDNVEKSICDGLNGAAWDDDSQIWHVEKWRHIDREEPRAEIVIRCIDADT